MESCEVRISEFKYWFVVQYQKTFIHQLFREWFVGMERLVDCHQE